MASEPTDLIRAVDEALDGITPAPWKIDEYDEGPLASIVSVADDRIGGWVEVAKSMDCDARFVAAAPDLVRRLRDALATAQDDNHTLADAYRSEHDRALRLAIRAAGADEVLAQRDEARAALAEANATIERVKALADTYGYTPNMTSVHHEIADQITRAIEGEQP